MAFVTIDRFLKGNLENIPVEMNRMISGIVEG